MSNRFQNAVGFRFPLPQSRNRQQPSRPALPPPSEPKRVMAGAFRFRVPQGCLRGICPPLPPRPAQAGFNCRTFRHPLPQNRNREIHSPPLRLCRSQNNFPLLQTRRPASLFLFVSPAKAACRGVSPTFCTAAAAGPKRVGQALPCRMSSRQDASFRISTACRLTRAARLPEELLLLRQPNRLRLGFACPASAKNK